MRLTKQMKEILAYSLALRVEEMAEGVNKELVKEMIANWQNQGIWGHEEDEEEGWEEEDAEDKHWKDVATYNERNSH